MLVGLLFGLILTLNFSRMVRKDYSHDEDQFIASAWLTGQDGLLPYRDYTYFHSPYLVFIYAALFRLSGETPLFTARIFSSLCGSAGIFLVFFLVLDFFRKPVDHNQTDHTQPAGVGYLVATAFAFLYLINPLTAAATGLSWNHDVMTLFMLLGFTVAFRAQDRIHPGRWLFASGLFLALAVGVRSSAVTVLPVYLFALLFFSAQRSIKKSLFSIVSWVSGFFVGLLPMLVLFLLAPQQFIFGNLEYALLNTRYRMDVPVLYNGNVAVYGPSSLVDKIDYLIKNIINQPAILFVLLGSVRLDCAVRRDSPGLDVDLSCHTFYIVGTICRCRFLSPQPFLDPVFFHSTALHPFGGRFWIGFVDT